MPQSLDIQSILPFGINRGYALGEVFQYFPEYVEWIMQKNDSWFVEKPRILIEQIKPTPFHGNEVFERLLDKYPILKDNCNGVPFQYNSLQYAKAVISEFKIKLEPFEDYYYRIMSAAKDFHEQQYEIESKLYALNPELYPAPERTLINVEVVSFDFSQEAYAANELKRQKSSTDEICF